MNDVTTSIDVADWSEGLFQRATEQRTQAATRSIIARDITGVDSPAPTINTTWHPVAAALRITQERANFCAPTFTSRR
jgi:hypothetical protein